MSIQHAIVPQHVSANFLGVYGQVTVNTAANTSAAYLDYTGLGGIYTRTGSTLNLLSSGSYTSAISWSSNGNGADRRAASVLCVHGHEYDAVGIPSDGRHVDGEYRDRGSQHDRPRQFDIALWGT